MIHSPEIEAAAREWCRAIKADPDKVIIGDCSSYRVWEAYTYIAKIMLSLRAEDAKKIAELKEAEKLARADAEVSKARVMVLEEEKSHEFNRGYLIACCNVANMHDEPAIACDVLAEGDLTEDDIEAAKLAEYDATALLEIRRARGDQDPIRAALTREGGV